MPDRRHTLPVALGLAAVVVGAAAYVAWRPRPTLPVAGIVRATQIRVAPEVGGQLASVKVRKGDHVRAGDIVAELTALELTAAVAQSRAALAAARAQRDNVYAGVRAEEIATLEAEVAKAESRLVYAKSQFARASYLARQDFAAAQALDQADYDVTAARTTMAEAQAELAAAKAGPTREERGIADAQVQAADGALKVLERRLEKMVLRAPADGVVGVVVAEIGEAVRAGQPVLAIEAQGREWLSFNIREDLLGDLAVSRSVNVVAGNLTGTLQPAIVTEIMPLGIFATWQAERAIGDHDRNTLRLRLDPVKNALNLEPGMTVWLSRQEENSPNSAFSSSATGVNSAPRAGGN